MKKEALLVELEQLAKDLGYAVRYEKGDFAGGSCLLHAQQLIMVNKRLPIEAKLAVLAKTFAEFELDNLSLKPAVREFIEDERARQKLKGKHSEELPAE